MNFLIFKFQKLRRITRLLLILLMIGGACFFKPCYALSNQAAVVSQHLQMVKNQALSKQIDHFLNHLIIASKDEQLPVFDKYAATIAGELDLQKLYFVTYKEVADLLDLAAKESIDALTLFTLPPLQDPKGAAIVFSADLLEHVNTSFDFHGLFNISVPSVEDGEAVKMTFLVIGQGKFIVGYNRSAIVRNADYNFATGKYDYRELFIMDAGKDSKGNPGLFNIKGMSEPGGKLQWMKGPFNVDIHSLTMTSDPDGQDRILIQYDLLGVKHKIIAPVAIEKL